MNAKAAEFDQFQIRLPPGMRDTLRAIASDNKRSMNAEIVQRLEESFSMTLLAEPIKYSDIPKTEARTIYPPRPNYSEKKEDDLINDLLFYEGELHKVARALRMLRNYKPKD